MGNDHAGKEVSKKSHYQLGKEGLRRASQRGQKVRECVDQAKNKFWKKWVLERVLVNGFEGLVPAIGPYELGGTISEVKN